MANGLAQGIQTGLAGLAAGIAQRRRSQYEIETQERAAKDLDAYLKTGVVGPGLMNVAPQLINALQPQQPRESGLPGSVNAGDFVRDETAPGGYRQVGEKQKPADPVRSPYARAVLGPDGNPKFVKQGGVTLQEYDLIDPVSNQSVGKKYEKIDDQSSKDPNVGNIKVSIISKFNSDPQVRKTQSSIDASESIIDLLDSNNPIADSAIPTYMARASGEVGNLSEPDKKPFGGSQALLAKIAQVVESLKSGKLTPENREFVRQLAITMARSARSNFNNHAKKYSKQYSRASKDLKESDILDMLNPDMTGNDVEQPTQLSPEDQQAIEWAKSNPNDPRSAKILQMHKMK